MQKQTPFHSDYNLDMAFRERCDIWEKHLHAFAELSESNDKPQDAVDGNELGALSGVTVAVKDIIDVAGLRTRNGSDACRDAAPSTSDAPVVADLRLAGARIVGKTTTTEFAFTDPTKCRNPYDTRRTPGGSSSGSGAAVASGLVDIALGTQTAGSLIRPAAYCGAVGFKPTYGVLSTAGVTPLAPSFDTVGIIARSVELAERAFDAMHAPKEQRECDNLSDLSATTALLPTDVELASETVAAFQDASEAFAKIGLDIQSLNLLADVDGVVANHRVAMNYEAFTMHRHLLSEGHLKELKPKFLAGLRLGATTTQTEFNTAISELATAKKAFWEHLVDVDIILTLPVPDGAPFIDGTTGFQDWLTPWTVFGGPLITLPWGLDSLGRPRAVMLAAHPGQDVTLFRVAAALETLAPPLPRPTEANL